MVPGNPTAGAMVRTGYLLKKSQTCYDPCPQPTQQAGQVIRAQLATVVESWQESLPSMWLLMESNSVGAL